MATVDPRMSADDFGRAMTNLARAQWCMECLTGTYSRFGYWLHRRGPKHRPLTVEEYRNRTGVPRLGR